MKKLVALLILIFWGCQKIDIPPERPITNIERATRLVDNAWAWFIGGSGFNIQSRHIPLLTGLATGEYSTSYGKLSKSSVNKGFLYKCITDIYEDLDSASSKASQALVRLDTVGLTYIPDTLRNRLRGELYFLRAISDFYKVNLFAGGHVLKYLNFDTRQIPDTDIPKYYERIIQDLDSAVLLLPDIRTVSYINNATQSAALALTARVYLYRKNYSEAEKYATRVIEKKIHDLYSTQSIFYRTASDLDYVYYTDKGFVPFDFVLVTINSELIAGDSPKRRNRTGSGEVPITEATPWLLHIFRMPEQHLIRAEARAKQNKIAEAREDINVLRIYNGAALDSSQTQHELLEAIYTERKYEFVGQGVYWFDLKRLRPDFRAE